MLTISKPLSAGQAQTCQQQEFTAKEQNNLVATRCHRGRMARPTGRAVRPCRDRFCEDFAKLRRGQHPHSSEQRVRQRASYA